MSNEAANQWKAYVSAQVPVIIKPTPDGFECDAPLVVVVEAAPKFVLGEFHTGDSAKKFCNQNGLPFTSVGN